MRFFLTCLLWLPPVVSAQTLPEPASLAATVSVSAPAAPDARGESLSNRGAAGIPAVIVTAEQWARPRSGRSVAAFPGLAALVAQLDRDPGEHLVLRYARGDETGLWAEELRAWLVALGLPSARIALEPGLPQSDKLLLELRPPR